MAEGFVNVTEGSGKKLHTFNRTIGANDVHDELVQLGEPYLATFISPNAGAIAIGTANDHIVELMAGATLNVYVRRIEVYQAVLVTAAAIAQFAIFTLSTAGTGGTAQTIRALDSTDSGSLGSSAMTLPTVKGTEVGRIWLGAHALMQTAPTQGANIKMFDIDFERLRGKALRIPAGVANGICFKNLAAYAGASVIVDVWFSEASF